MKFRLKVKVSKKMWKTGIVVYNSLQDATNRMNELKSIGIDSFIVDEFGGRIN